MKHVEASEFNPFEAVQTNVIGTQNVMEAALDCGVEKVLGISTDKAINPTTLYGATKLCAERLLIAGNAYAGWGSTRFAVIRFGNIAFSRGSVIPKWREMLKTQDWVPVTDPECTRYWITSGHAAMRAKWALQTMKGGEVSFLPTASFRVADLAEAMGAKMRIVGLGPGERLHEDKSDLVTRLTVEELRGFIA